MMNQSVESAFAEAELAIKKAEFIFVNDNTADIDGLLFPPVNELRYAGKHLSEAACGNNPEEHYAKAEHHCKRALYDALDASLLFLLYKIDSFLLEYRGYIVKKVLPDYSAIADEVDRIREEQALTNDRDVEGTQKRIDSLEEIYKKLKTHKAELDYLTHRDNIIVQAILYVTIALCFISLLIFLVTQGA